MLDIAIHFAALLLAIRVALGLLQRLTK